MGHNGPAIDDRFAEDDAFDERQGRIRGLSDAEFDLREFRAALYRNRWLIGGICSVGILLGLLLALLTTPIYEAETTLQIDQSGPQIFDDSAENPGGENMETESYLDTQVEVLQSRSLADRVARRLNFYRSPAFFEGMDAEAPEAAPGSERWQRAVIGILSNNLTVEQVGDTRLVALSFTSPTPRLSAQIANTYSEEFVASTLQRRFDMSAYSRDFLSGQLEQTRQQLEDSERALIEGARAQGITNLGGGENGGSGGGTLTASNLNALNNAYAQARSDRILAEQRWQQARNTPTMRLPEVLSNSTVQALNSQRAQLQAQLEGERERRGSEYPTVMQMEAQLQGLDNQIQQAAAQVRSSIQEQYELARDQENDLLSNVRSLQQDTLGEQSRGVQLTILQREADTNRALYDALLQRYRELNAASGITANNISIIDQAQTPTVPVWPQPLINALLGGLIGFAVAALLAFVRERMDDTIRAPEEVERKLGIPLLGIIPKPESDDIEEELATSYSPMSESIYALHTSLQLSTRDGVPKTLLITSTRPAEGKSTTSYAIAREFAQSGLRVALIDADMRRPNLHHMFGNDNKSGFSNVLASGKIEPENIITTDIENLSVIVSGPTPPSPPRLLSPEVLHKTFEELHERFDMVVVDSPPVLGLADALQLSAGVDAVLFVIEANNGAQGQTKSALRRLIGADANLIGAVLTKFDATRTGYGDYGYGNYYSYHPSAES